MAKRSPGSEVGILPERAKRLSRVQCIRSFDPDKTLCGSTHKHSDKPVIWDGMTTCVVCDSLWQGMPSSLQRALSLFWEVKDERAKS